MLLLDLVLASRLHAAVMWCITLHECITLQTESVSLGSSSSSSSEILIVHNQA
jgi:hypothetical protein